jgi:hypothetical protein
MEVLYMVLIIFVIALILWAIYYIFTNFLGGGPSISLNAARSNMGAYTKVTSLSPLGSSEGKLCDYYVASSAYSVFPSTNTSDFISDGIIPLVVKAGARLIELDIYDEDGKPVVGLKNDTLGYSYAKNSIPLESCCRALANTAFNSVETSVSSDPFILSLMFHTDNTNTLNSAAEIIKNSTLNQYFLNPDYAFHRKNLAQEPIENLKGKLIIVSGGVQNTLMDELINLSWSTSNLRRLTYMQASQPYDHQELIESNKKSICMVIPDPDPDLKNNNPSILFGYGCQWNLMNYGSLDMMMELNLEKFQQGSFVLKPDELRFKPVEAKKAVLPDPQTHSFQPMMHTSPIYDSNPTTGDKSIVI